MFENVHAASATAKNHGVKQKLAAALAVVALAAVPAALTAEDLVIVHTNDTHSQLDPNEHNLGGVKRRQVVIDSIRAAHPNTILVDAGDAVQGSLFFTLYGGEAEERIKNALGYDYATLGNHEFDNGVDALAKNLKLSKTTWLSTNYDLSKSAIAPYFKPYAIRQVGDKKVGIIALNLRPKGMISDGNYEGVEFLDPIKAANATAWHLKHNEKVDAVIALTHLGYKGTNPSDLDVAKASEDIDVIIGGHSHTSVTPGSGMEWVENANGKKVLVAQAGKSGLVVGEIVLDLDNMGTKLPEYKYITIDSRLDSRTNNSLDSIFADYREGVDRMANEKVGRTAVELVARETPLLNFIADFIKLRGEQLIGGKVDMSIANRGSLRNGLPKGTITQGQVINVQPFANHVLVEEIKGSDLLDAFNVMAARGGDGVSDGVEAIIDPATGKCTSVTINGAPLDTEKTYRVATIDYLYNGGDYMAPLSNGKKLVMSKTVIYEDLIPYIKSLKNKKINPSPLPRMHRPN